MANLHSTSSTQASVLALRTLAILAALVVPVLCLQASRGNASFDWPRLAAWASCLIGCVALVAVAGKEVRGRTWGALVDERNRYSLSRLQMCAWAVLVVATLYVVFIANLIRAAQNPMDIKVDVNLFALMGISITSLVASPTVLNRKADQAASANELEKTRDSLVPSQNLRVEPTTNGRILVKGDVRDARIADLIRGEDVGNAAVIDISRSQMLMITALCIITYAANLGDALGRAGEHLAALPDIGQTLLLLTLVSHGGYIAGKLVSPTNTTDVTTEELRSRAHAVSQQAVVLVGEVKDSIARLPLTDARRQSLERMLMLGQSLASDAAALACQPPSGNNFGPVSAMEGRVEAARASLKSIASPSAYVGSAPSTETVGKVQGMLASEGKSVRVTGIPDVETERAIDVWLAAKGVARSNLHPDRMRFYEELAQLMLR